MTAMVLADTDWHEDALNIIRAFAASGLTFTADDLRNSIRPAPQPNDIGNVFQSARKAGMITCVGFRESMVPSRRRGVVRVWERA
jgi:hypothetical protein